MNISKLILSFSCGKVNFSRSILLLKTGFYMSEEMEVACLLCLSDDKSSPETFWAICQMTNRSQRRFEPFVRWQIARRDVLGRAAPSTSRKMTIWACLYSGVFAWKGIFMDCHASLAMTGMRSLDCHASLAMTGVRSLDCHASLAMTGLVHEFTKVFLRVRG